MAKQGTAGTDKPSLPARVTSFFNEVTNEMKKVAWPSLEEVKASTSIVLMLVVILAGVIYAYDLVFLNVINLLLTKLG